QANEKVRCTRSDHEQRKDEHIHESQKVSKCRASDQTKRSNTIFYSDKKSPSFTIQHCLDKTRANRNVTTDDSTNPVIWTAVISEFPVHECVFRGDVRCLYSLIRTQNIAHKDMHGELVACSVLRLNSHCCLQF
uniref:Uncharacterized protein n=1 Tax=Electrophorus electricus TaxID=8005 RepID=A0A4W4GFJ1_ELEEL